MEKSTTAYKIILGLCAISLIIAIILSARQSYDDGSILLSEAELSVCDLLVHNVTCSEIHEVRTVPDAAFRDVIISLIVTTEPFRPTISSDLIMGKQPDAYFILENEKTKYTVTFFDAEKQLSLDYVFRDAPLISVEKAEIDELGQPQSVWGWYCTFSAAEYAMLYDAIQTYVEGELIL